MELNVVVPGSKASKKQIDVSDLLFGCEFNEALVHQIVTAYLAGGRAGTSAQKTRAEVSGGNKKPWRQKGTGRARAGSTRSPIWRGGGVTFASKTRDYSQKVNKKMYRRALRSILSELIRQECLTVVEKLEIKEPKTKLLIAELGKLKLNNALIILDQVDETIELAARNIPYVSVLLAREINPVALMKCDHVVVTEAALKQLEEKLA